MFTIIQVCDVCEGMQINYSDKVVTVLGVKKNKGFVTITMSNGVCKCYGGTRLVKRY
jgi:hypothetical protein